MCEEIGGVRSMHQVAVRRHHCPTLIKYGTASVEMVTVVVPIVTQFVYNC